jgi:Phage integrase, N-terminal SAM-like domain
MASVSKRPDGQWRARYRDETGKEHAKHFARKVDGQRWLDEVTASMVRGEYVDPRAGRVTFKAYAEQWRASQVHRVTSQLTIESALRRHTYPTLGDKPLSAIKPSDVQAWVKRLSERLAPRASLGHLGARCCRWRVQGGNARPADRLESLRRDGAAEGAAPTD